ncbi:MAG: FmdB family transcriptional regulator [Streptosporangiaceae bacterium]|nr:FmdB family transcriptional regulator [Streptosporangiaceae bacterium]MBV9856396.1 FmdB family transcriptional regulator [Streptosporangiaceae bacterium]
MPTYQYRCTECGGEIEAVQKFTDAPLTQHEACGGRLRKVFSPVGIVFKGSGFYRTDSRNGSPAPASAAGPAAGQDSGSGGEKKSSGTDAASTSGSSDSAKASPGSPANGSAPGKAGSSPGGKRTPEKAA